MFTQIARFIKLRFHVLKKKTSKNAIVSLIENIGDVIFQASGDGIVTYISPGIEKFTGFRPDQIVGKSFRDIIYREDLPHLEAIFPQILDGKMNVIEFRVLDRENNFRYIRSYIRQTTSSKQPDNIQGLLTDITERKNVEEAIEKRASQMDLLHHIGEQIVAVNDPANVIQSATQLIKDNFGYYHVAIFTPAEKQNILVLQSVSSAYAEKVPENYCLLYGQGLVGWAAESRTIQFTNNVLLEPRFDSPFPDEITTRSELAIPIMVGEKMTGVLDIQSPANNAFNENDMQFLKTLTGQIAIAMENARLYQETQLQVQELKRRENLLRVQRDLLVHLSAAETLSKTLHAAAETLATEFNASRTAISLYDPICQAYFPALTNGRTGDEKQDVPLVKQEIATWVARNRQPLLIQNANNPTRTAHNLLIDPAFLYIPLVSNGKSIGVITLESKIASSFSQEDLQSLNSLANSLVMVIERASLFEEVKNARAELEVRATELEEANSSLRELDRLKSQFLANISHELRTPLNSIIGFSEVMIDGLAGQLNDEQMEYSQDILDSGRHLLAIINDLLDFSKIVADKMVLKLSTFQVEDLFDELRSAVSPLIMKKSQHLVFHPSDSLPTITADYLKIKQVFINLISNANKFTPDYGTITVSCQLDEPTQLLFTVQDTGIGIRLEDQEIIFEEFRQADGSLNREATGTGLGLAISQHIIELHQGKIWVESEIGKGASFFIRLPQVCWQSSPQGAYNRTYTT